MRPSGDPELTTTDIDGPVRLIDTGGGEGAPTTVLVHGLGASHLSWRDVVPLLSTTDRVLAPDLVGFGHSAPLGRGTGVTDNRDVLVRLLRRHVDGPVTLVGNSMGGMVAILLAHAHPTLVSRLVLVNPALPGVLTPGAVRAMDPTLALYFVAYNTPLAGTALLRLRRARTTPAQQVHQLLAQICGDPARVDPETVTLLVALTAARRRYAWSDQAFLQAQRSIMRQLTAGRRRYLDAIRGLRMPTLLVHGDADRLVDVSAARAIAQQAPRIQLEVLPDIGHAPQLEAPAQLAGLIRDWTAGTGRDGSAAPGP